MLQTRLCVAGLTYTELLCSPPPSFSLALLSPPLIHECATLPRKVFYVSLDVHLMTQVPNKKLIKCFQVKYSCGFAHSCSFMQKLSAICTAITVLQ